MDRFNAYIQRNRVFFTLALYILLVASSANGAEFIIFHTSDVHGSIAAHADPVAKEEPKPLIGGYAVLQNLINSHQADPANAGARMMYFDSGDFFQGTPIVDRTQGGVMIEMLNLLKAKGVTLGNHEFDYSYQTLVEKMKKRDFPVICCNIFEKKTGKLPPFVTPYVVYAHQGKKIGVIGVDTTETESISFEKNVKDLIFADPVPLVKPIIEKLRKGGVDFIILLSHLGFDGDVKFASQVEGIDLILGGHTHSLKKEFFRAEPYNTPIIHSGSSCEHASVIRVDLEDNAKPQIKVVSTPLYVDKIGYDPRIKAIEDELLKDIRAEMQREIGESKVNLYRGISGGDSPEGSLIADSMRKYSGADFAFINFGGVRQPFFKGKISVEDVFMVQPFDNYVEVIEMNGAQLRDLLEKSVSNATKLIDSEDRAFALENYNIRAEGLKLAVGDGYGFLLPSGMKITYDPSQPPMKRLVKLESDDGKEIEAEKIYTVAMNDFIASGGDGFVMLREFKNRKKTELLVRSSLINYIEEMKVITERPEKRIFNLKLTEENLD